MSNKYCKITFAEFEKCYDALMAGMYLSKIFPDLTFSKNIFDEKDILPPYSFSTSTVGARVSPTAPMMPFLSTILKI